MRRAFLTTAEHETVGETHGKVLGEGSEDAFNDHAALCLYANVVAHLRGGSVQEM
jgi:hypothetical protein